MIQTETVLKSHSWYCTTGVQCIFCPKALFSRNVKQDFSVQQPEYSGMGFFIFSSYSAEIWLSHENVSQHCWELLHRAKERWSLHYTTPLNPRWIIVYSFHYKALLHPATEINLIFSSEVKVALNEITSSAREKSLENTFTGTLRKSKIWHQAATSIGMKPRWQVSVCFFFTDHKKKIKIRKSEVPARAKSGSFDSRTSTKFPPWQMIHLVDGRP